MGIEDHLLRLARIGPNKKHAAVTQANMGDLYRGRDPVDEHDLMAPVELVSLAGIKGQGNIGCG